MREGWKAMKMKEICELLNGRAYKQQELLGNGKYRVLRVGNFFTNKDWYYSDLELPENKYCCKGDLLYAWSASFGPRMWNEEKVIYHYHIWKVLPNEEHVTKEFLFRLLEWDVDKIKEDHGTGTTMIHVGKASMEERELPIPPLDEQRHIVEVLSQAFAAIEKAKENLEENLRKAKELFEVYFQSVLTNRGPDWEESKLDRVINSVEYGTSSKSKSAGKTPVLRMGNVQDGRLDWNDLVYTIDEEEIRKYQLRYNDVLFNRTNSAELVGKTAIFKGERPAIFAGYLIRINRKEELIDADFLNYYLNSKKARRYGFSVMTSSVNQANINGTKLKEYPIILPPLKTQQAIVKNLDNLAQQTNNLTIIYKKKLARLDELKKSILQKAFSGELIEANPALIA